MAQKTPIYEFEKPEQNDFYDVDVQNKNWDAMEEALTKFDDSGKTDDIKSFPNFLTKFVTGNKLAITMRNLKAGLQFVLHTGQIVNNCVTDNSGLPLSAAQGKVLMDLYTKLYSDLSPIGTLYWSEIETIQCSANTWTLAKNSIVLPAGKYVIFAHASLTPGNSVGTIRINNTDVVEAYQSYMQSTLTRRVTTACMYSSSSEKTFKLAIYDSLGTSASDCEVCAIRIK